MRKVSPDRGFLSDARLHGVQRSMSALPKKLYTLEGYLELDKNSEERYEFFEGAVFGAGEAFAMAGGSLNHGRIIANATHQLVKGLEGKDCEVLPADVRIKVPAALPYRYSDLSVVCGEAQIEEFAGQQLLLNPVLLIEVLSPTTEAYDLGAKFTAYQSISSFREYVVFAQNAARVVHHLRQPDNKWLRTDIIGIGSSLTLETLDITLALRDVYRHVKFVHEVLP